LSFTICLLFIAPYAGFSFNPYTGEILVIYDSGLIEDGLRVGDLLQRVGSVSLDSFREDKTLQLFENAQRGQLTELGIQRDGKERTVPMTYQGFHSAEFSSRFFNVWWLAYIFWFIGMTAHLFVRPRDVRRNLMIAANYLMGIFIIMGSISIWQIWWSSILLRVVAWLILPVYIHLHLVFPSLLIPLAGAKRYLLYFVGLGFVAAEILLPTPRFLFYFALIFAFGGSFVLLGWRYIVRPKQRGELRLLAAAAFLAFLPAVGISLIGRAGDMPNAGPLSLTVLPILPATYLYVLYRQSLGGLELRVNRAFSLYIFMILLGVFLVALITYAKFVEYSPQVLTFAIVIIALFTTFAGILLFPGFQSWIDRRLLGINLSSPRLAEEFSVQIVATDTMDDLLRLLKEQVFPSLFVRQYAFVQIVNSSPKVMLLENATLEQLREDALMEFIAYSPTGELVPLPTANQHLSWVRLLLPLRLGPDLIGAWLLGRRDPDDHYPQAELPILQSLANQTAIALSNIVQTERLKAMYHANINRYEEERNRLGRDLHDSVLNEMAAILSKHEELSQVPGFMDSYNLLIQRLREIISDLRPPSLTYGLKFALEGLADHLSERHHDKIRILADLRMDGTYRYPEVVENNVYRIVQEACENALKYARASSITITGELLEGEINLEVMDDGIGFATEINLPLDNMVANKHFGLAGMHERADLIGAVVRINSKPGQGAKVGVVWESKDTPAT